MKSKKLQKVLAIFLALGMLISYLPISASAQAPVAQDEIVLESDPQAGTGEYLNLGDPLPADYQPMDGEIEFILDDGTGEDAIGTSGGAVSIVALNRFSPGNQFPFLLTEISFLSNHATGSVLAPGQPLRLVVFQNTSTEGVVDPSDGAELVLEVDETVQVANGWNVYELADPILLEGPGDVLIGALFEHRPGSAYYPAVVDEDTVLQRSWIGLWSGEAPRPLTIPSTGQWGEIGVIGFPGTFTMRGKGIPAGNAELAGTVTNSATSAPLAGATVTATPTEGNPRSATTDANGKYSIKLDAGTYSVTAAKLGYESKTETVTVPEGQEEPYIKDFALVQLAATQVSGTVKDGGITGTTDKHGYPLYAKLSFTTMGVTEVAYTNPFTGAYSITLVRDTAYTVKVESLTTNYLPFTETFTTAGETQTKNFELLVPVEACRTAGYGVSGAMADFDDQQLPAGWTNYDYQGSGQVWQFNNPGGRGNLTPGSGSLAVLESDKYGIGGVQHAGLRTPVLDFSAAPSVTLEFDSYYYTYSGQTGMVRYSTDGGTTWTTKLTLPATTQGLHYTVQLPELAGQAQAMVEFKFQASWGYYWQIDNVSLGDPTCEIKDGGVVTGYVFDANEDEVKLLDAKVETALASDTTTASVDPAGNGLYWFFQPTTATTEEIEFTISKSKYVTVIEDEDVEQDEINHIDFELGAGHLVADPTAVEVSMELGEADRTETLFLENDGSAAATWSMAEKAGGFTPMKVSIPAFTGTLPESNVPTSMFRDPNAKSTGKPGLVLNSNAEKFGITEIVEAYGIDLGNDSLYRWENVGAPAAYQLVGTPGGAATSLFAGDFMGGDFDTLYVVSYDNNKLFAVDTSDASITEIGTTTPASGTTFGGLAGGADVMYGMASECNVLSKLYTIDLDNATTTFVGDVNGPNCIIDITYVPDDGMLYGVDLVTNNFYRIDPATAQATMVGALGADPNYAQGMDYDEENNIMYWAAYTTQPELRVIDMTTGASALVGAFTGLDEVDSFSVAAGGAPIDRIPWLSEDVLEGDLDVDEEQAIELTFTVANIGQPGKYDGQLVVKDDSPYQDLLIPVTLNVTRPANFGSFKGTIYALEQCDIEPAPAEKATVIFYQNGAEKYRTKADENGYFSYAMLEGTYDIEIELDGYVSQIFEGLELEGGEDYILDDVNLRLDAPCLIVEPDALYQEQYTGEINSQTVTFTNIGAKETVFELTEKDMGGPVPFFSFNPFADNPIQDPGFEAYTPNPYWDEFSANYGTPLCDAGCGTGTGTGPHTGQIWSWFGGVDSGVSETGYVSQDVDFPNGSATMKFWVEQMVCGDSGSANYLALQIDGTELWRTDGTDPACGVLGYRQIEVDVSAFADGNTHEVKFASATVGSGNFFLDDVELTGEGGGGGGGTGGDILWLDIDVMADVVMPGDSVEVTFTFDSNGLLWGDYFGTVRVANQPDPTFDIPVQLRVNDWEWQFLPLINMKWPLPAGK